MATWRQMTDGDIPAVVRIADEIHRDLPERESVFRERLSLFPAGCLVLVKNDDDNNEIGGYIVSFPIRHDKPPTLNAPLGEIPSDADQYYLHDLSILPGFRGQGSAASAIKKVLRVAGRYPTTCLISVYGTGPFWAQFGFHLVPVDEPLREKLRGYGEDATYMMRRNA